VNTPILPLAQGLRPAPDRRRRPGVMVRDHGHVTALDTAALAAAATTRRPHRRKERIPHGPTACAAADVRRGVGHALSPVIDLATYERAARGRNTLT
jgi:hypothetical protein